MTQESPDIDNVFNYATHVELHSLEANPNIKSIVSVASEHNFRGIVVIHPRIEELSKEIKKQGSEVKPIAVIDYPLGCSSLEARNFCIISAREKGAKEVEIVAPYHFIIEKDFKQVENDLRTLTTTVIKNNVNLKYIIDLNSSFITENVLSRLSRIASANNTMISTSTGWFDKKISHSDNILKIRALKNKSDVRIKSYIAEGTVDDIISYNKAGVDIIGLDTQRATSLVYSYQEKIA